jgi:hypothetical protein
MLGWPEPLQGRLRLVEAGRRGRRGTWGTVLILPQGSSVVEDNWSSPTRLLPLAGSRYPVGKKGPVGLVTDSFLTPLTVTVIPAGKCQSEEDV